MISRVAEHCFWLNRYIERTDTTARLVSVNRLTVLDADIHDARRWKPIVVVTGEQDRFEELLGERAYDRDNEAEEYLTWSEENPSSIHSSLAGARENARMTREVISREMWETLNTAWQWFNGVAARKEYKRDREQFYLRIRRVCAEFQGECYNSMLHDEPFDFMRLGMLLERVGQTARVMDVKHHWLAGGPSGDVETPQEAAQWMALLRLCTAVEPFFKRYSAAPTGPMVLQFMLQDVAFPGSVLHCLARASNFLERIDKQGKRRSPSATRKMTADLSKRVRRLDVSALSSDDLHTELNQLIESTSKLCNQVRRDFFEVAPAAGGA